MITVKRIAGALGIAMAIGMVIQLAAPRAVHGVVATLVSVVGNVAVANPLDSGGNPQPLVIRDADTGARQQYYASQQCTITTTSATDCLGQTPATVPPGKILALQDVAGWCRMDQPGYSISQSVVFIYAKPVNPGAPTAIMSLPINAANGTVINFGRQVSWYLSAGDSFVFQNFSGASDQSGECFITYAGYLINQ